MNDHVIPLTEYLKLKEDSKRYTWLKESGNLDDYLPCMLEDNRDHRSKNIDDNIDAIILREHFNS